MKDQVIFKNSKDEYTSLDSYLDRMKEKTKEKIIYADNKDAQASLLQLLNESDLEAIVTNSVIDNHFIPYLEMKSAGKYKFVRIDSDESTHLLGDDQSEPEIIDPKDNKSVSEKLAGLFTNFLNNDKIKVKCQSLKSEKVPAMLLFDENMRRMKEMMSMSPNNMLDMGNDDGHTLVVNSKNPAIKNLLTLSENPGNDSKVDMMIHQVYDLAKNATGYIYSRNDARFCRSFYRDTRTDSLIK